MKRLLTVTTLLLFSFIFPCSEVIPENSSEKFAEIKDYSMEWGYNLKRDSEAKKKWVSSVNSIIDKLDKDEITEDEGERLLKIERNKLLNKQIGQLEEWKSCIPPTAKLTVMHKMLIEAREEDIKASKAFMEFDLETEERHRKKADKLSKEATYKVEECFKKYFSIY